MKQLSVIIPLYNCEQFINQAIDSILCQVNVDIEIIIVNDGSTDNSLHRVEKYGDKVNVVNINNSGASAARNIGLKKATGKYVMFMDSDDFLSDSGICQETIMAMENHNVEMGMFSYTYYDNDKKVFIDVKPYSKSILKETDSGIITRELVKSGTFFASPCFKIISRDFLIRNSIFFLEGTTAEDIEWYVNILRHIKRCCVVNNYSYIYRTNVSSSVTRSFSKEKCKNHVHVIEVSSKELLCDIDSNKKNSLLSALAYQYCILLSNCFEYKKDRQLVNEIKALSWLLNYQEYPHVRYIRWIYKTLGFNFTSYTLYQYKKHLAKSN